jgi:hypothetical protein
MLKSHETYGHHCAPGTQGPGQIELLLTLKTRANRVSPGIFAVTLPVQKYGYFA